MSTSHTLPVSARSRISQPSQERDHQPAKVPAIEALAVHHSPRAGAVVETATNRKQKEIEVDLAHLQELMRREANED